MEQSNVLYSRMPPKQQKRNGENTDRINQQRSFELDFDGKTSEC
jgi:hypothetical protein